jgi:hypothetical protein
LRPPPDLLQKRRPSRHSPGFSEMPIVIAFSENAEYRYEVDVVVIQLGFVMQHRSLSFGR